MNMNDFLQGNSFDAFRYFGAHPEDGGTRFRTYAPNAWKAGVCGDFSNWDILELNRVHPCGIFEAFVPGAHPGMKYLYRIYDKKGNMLEHCDPFGAGMEYRPFSASIIRDLDEYHFQDHDWIRTRTDRRSEPLNIYEVHLGSWQKNEAGSFSYLDAADRLIPYMKDCGYNYLEVLPLTEFPCVGSWGFLTSCFYSPTSRYGNAKELMQMIDRFHQNGIGVILDFVPGHFAVDAFGLSSYDGTCLYEYPYEDVRFNEWGSLNFHLARPEVQSFLCSAAAYWIEIFHFDGLRIDSVSNILYWQGQRERGVNKGAVSFLRHMNSGLKRLHPDILIAAEDSTEFPHVTGSVESGGLGFDYKWDMGWMHDTLEYMQMDPYLRSQNCGKLSFSMWYFRSERFLLPLSHDEVVHGKASILQKMNGGYENKIPQAKVLYSYMYIHPGKKLNFMGNEIGQLREWSEKSQEDWALLSDPAHQQFHSYMKALNHIYLYYRELHLDDLAENFEWADVNTSGRAIFAIRRKTDDSELLAVLHFDCDPEAEYSLTLPEAYQDAGIRLILHSNHVSYGGSIGDWDRLWRLEQPRQPGTDTASDEANEKHLNETADRQTAPVLKIQMAPYDCLLFHITFHPPVS